MGSSIPLGWKLKKGFWARWQTLRFKLSKPQQIDAPTNENPTIDVVALREANSKIPAANVMVYDHLPREEARLAMRILVGAGLWLTKVVPPMRDGLPEVAADPHEALEFGLTKPYRSAFRAPVLPGPYAGPNGPALEELAVASPYAVFLQRDADGRLCWDFRMLADFEHHPGLRSLGVYVSFGEVEGTSQLETTQIDSDEYGNVRPGDAAWNDSRLLAVCAATTHMAMTRHFNYVHLISGNHWDVATRNHLPIDHPLYRLLWPHFFNSLYTNHGVTRPQLLPDGDFVNMFSLTHAGLMAYYDEMYSSYDIRITDPEADWTRRGLADESFDHPSQQNLVDVFTVMHEHTAGYIDTYYQSDEQLRADAAVSEWIAALDGLIPNGVAPLLGQPVTRPGLARLIGAYMYEGNTIHDLAGTTLWDYQLWPHHNPTRIASDGSRVPVDVFQRVINNNFALQLRRAPLLADYRDVALDARGAARFTEFSEACSALQERYDRAPAGPWRMEPKNLEINMNG